MLVASVLFRHPKKETSSDIGNAGVATRIVAERFARLPVFLYVYLGL